MTTAVARNGRATRSPLKVYGPNGVGKPAVPPTKRPVGPKPRGQRKPKRRQNGSKPGPAVENGDGRPLEDVGGSSPSRQEEKLDWQVEEGAAPNYGAVGERLAARDDLKRNGTNGHGLVQVLPDGSFRLIKKGPELAPLIVDYVPMQVTKNGKVVSELPAAHHLNTMLRSEMFLGKFKPVDEITKLPVYLDDFSLVPHGYHDYGPGKRILYLGDEPLVVRSLETIHTFLDMMPFTSNADRTNTVGAGLTVLLRWQWLGEKPLILVKSTLSHGGKGTITDFFCGRVPKANLLYENLDWPIQEQFQKQIQTNPDIGVVVFDNVRVDSAGGRAGSPIRSAFVEGFVTSDEITLASPGAGEVTHFINKYVLAINTNDGAFSPDMMNRSISINVAPIGDIQDRLSLVKENPKLEFLPRNRERIEAELRGMIEKWKEAGCPLDTSVRHPMTRWARTIGGILRVNGFTDFLGNYGTSKTIDDPIREALGILGAAKFDTPLRPTEWADLAVEQGLAKTLFGPNERDTPKGRERAIGRIFKRHREIIFDTETETMRYRLKLEGGCKRWKRQPPHVRYVFTKLKGEPVEADTPKPQRR